MDINLDELPHAIYACFVLHNFCEMNNESISEEHVQSEIDQQFQPQTASAGYSSANCSEVEGKRVRMTLTKYFDS